MVSIRSCGYRPGSDSDVEWSAILLADSGPRGGAADHDQLCEYLQYGGWPT
jgi:hypothetical protein